jgi:cleavage and polyadenylation specificity factor subunit 3
LQLDIGIHPGMNGLDALPYTDTIEPDEIDLLLVSQWVNVTLFIVRCIFCHSLYSFHLDHSGGLPWFLEKTSFKGRCFMTHASKAIYRWLLSDYVKVR